MLETIFTRTAAILAAATGEARRILHGRGQTYPGLEHVTLDWYPPLLLLVLYREPEPGWLAALARGLQELTAGSARCLLVQYRCRPGTPTLCLWGVEPASLDAVEAGLRFRIHPAKAQNIGFFPDMAAGRKLVRKVARERRVLNLFAYTCSFSVAALAGGAREVVNLDMHRRSLDIGRLNHQLNGLDLRQAHFLPHDLFKSFGKLRRLGPFDLVIVDPPGPQGQSFQPRRDWPKLLGRLDQLLAPGGEVITALSAPGPDPGFLRVELARQAPRLALLNRLRAGDDFPESDPDRGLTLFHLRRT